MFKLAILGNENPDENELWIKAIDDVNDASFDYDVIDLSRNNWLENVTAKNYDYYLCKPPGLSACFKQLYDERIYIIASVLKLPVYPSLTEILIYENKRLLSFWLEANDLPHPKTDVFYDKDEASSAIQSGSFPIVAKTNIGASGSGVKILHSYNEAQEYINNAFSSRGTQQRWWPNFKKRGIFKRGLHYIFNPNDIKKKADIYKRKKNEIQKGFVLLQEYIEHEFEWRVVVIGDSYFAHKKLKIGEKASGSTLKGYDNPPIRLFDFAKDIMEKYGLYSQAIDLFETKDGELLINEMQCIFGQSDSYQMLVDGQPGRYRFINGMWVFEAGKFNENESYNLRIKHVLNLVKGK